MDLQTKRWKTGLAFAPVVILLALMVLGTAGCGAPRQPVSPEAAALKQEILDTLQHLQKSLVDPVAREDIPAIDAVLAGLAKNSVDICVDCPYRSAVLNKDGVVLTTFPKNDFIGRDFSSYRIISEPLSRQRITQRQIYRPDGVKMYSVSAPLLRDNKVAGVVVLTLAPLDITKKWRLTEKEFLAINFNTP